MTANDLYRQRAGERRRRCEGALARLYAAFADAPKPRLAPAGPRAYDAEWIGQTPLHALPLELVNDFAFELGYTVGGVDDVRYFLPLLWDLALRGELASTDDPFLDIGNKLARFDWQRWSEPERRVVEALVSDFFEASLDLELHIEPVLTLVVVLFDDVAPWLSRIRRRDDVQGVRAIRALAGSEGERCFVQSKHHPRSPYTRERPAQEAQLRAWLRAPETLAQVRRLREQGAVDAHTGEDLTWLCDEAEYWLALCHGTE